MSKLEGINRSQLGKFIRQYRKERGLKISSLTEEGLSQATISNIERGVVTVTLDRIERLCEKLNIDMNDMIEKIKNIDSQRALLKLKLRSIESIIVHSANGAKKALQMLDRLELLKSDPLFATVQYLRGKCLIRKKSWYKAKIALQQAIECVDLNPELKRSNLKAASYYELGRICYYTGEYEQALTYAELAEQSFESKGERNHFQYFPSILKVFCLEMLERYGEALQDLSKIWVNIDKIDDMRIIANLYETQISLLIKMNLYHEAEKYALEGIEIARRNELTDRAFELWIALGRIYYSLSRFEEAILALDTAREMEDSVKNKDLLIDAYTQLGIVYLGSNKPKEAIKYLKLAIEYSKNPNTSKLIDTFSALGDCYLELQQYEKALAFYQNALEKAQANNITSKERDITAKACYCIEQMEGLEKYSDLLFNLYRNLVRLTQQLKGGEKL